MSSQNTLITCANDNEVKRPSGTMVSRQFYRDKSAQGSGIYKAMDENGNIEIIGGPGSGFVGGSESGSFSRSAASGSGVQTIATTKRVKMVWFIAKGDASASSTSNGIGDSINNSCVSLSPIGPTNADLLNSINISSSGNGMTGLITAIANNSFDFTWTKIGAGQNIDVKWFAITN